VQVESRWDVAKGRVPRRETKVKIFVIFIAIVPLFAYGQTRPKGGATPKPDQQEVSAALRAAAIDALSCLNALSEGILEISKRAFADQKMRCAELVSKADLTAQTKREHKIAAPIGTMLLQVEACRSTAESGAAKEVSECLEAIKKSRTDAEDELRASK
jgi:hypothetical protein